MVAAKHISKSEVLSIKETPNRKAEVWTGVFSTGAAFGVGSGKILSFVKTNGDWVFVAEESWAH
jgi:hypothetical protein